MNLYIVVAPNGKVVYAGDYDGAAFYEPDPEYTGDTYRCYMLTDAVPLWGDSGA